MVSVAEATDIVFSNLFKTSRESVNLTDSIGRVLGEAVYADRDFPPFNRVAMDGLAINFQEWMNGTKEFTIETTHAAGQPSIKLKNKQHAIEVMTGSILPTGTDTVIRYEDLDIKNGKATIVIDGIQRGQHVHHQATDAGKDGMLLEPHCLISSAEIALMASVGKSKVSVLAFPKAAIISSGDELVEVDRIPQPHQIRRSNTYALAAAMKQVGWNGTQYHLQDKKDLMTDSLKQIVADHDVLIISGGVSKGKFDFIPEALEAAGVRKLFHQVNQRPGKPFWFGKSLDGKIVFALPGNPVSTYMCFYRYILPWLWKSLGVDRTNQQAILGKDFSFAPVLTYFLQVSIKNENGKLVAYPDAGGGSGDFANLKKVDGFLELTSEKEKFSAGEVYPYYSFRG
jgi:molybdopterin molybdotransferase